MNALAQTPEKITPHNLEVEAGLIAAILRNNKVFDVIDARVSVDDFYAPVHRRLYELIAKIIRSGQVASLATLSHIIKTDALLQEIDAVGYVNKILESLTQAVNAVQFAQVIADLSIKRQLIAISDDISDRAYFPMDMDDNGARQIEAAEQALFQLSSAGTTVRKIVSLEDAGLAAIEAAGKAYKRGAGVVGVATGFTDLDRLLGGLHPSDLVIIAGRPAMGKTAFATNIALHAARNFAPGDSGDTPKAGARVLFFSLEMAADQIAPRISATTARISCVKIRTGRIQAQQFY
ncbi:MAG: DnaB-like helicase C-terminal domain-containing protein, partial [Pseudomonadota bacterium]